MKQQNENPERFATIIKTATEMLTSQKVFTQDAYTDLVLEAISCAPPSFAKYIQDELLGILEKPTLQHMMEEGIPIYSMEQVTRYHHRSDEILNAATERLANG